MPHIPVLLQPSLDSLALKPGDVFLDATLGGGGHSEAVVRKFGAKVKIIGIDLDQARIDEAREKFAPEKTNADFTAVQGNFRNLDIILNKLGVQTVDKILFDLGVSSMQLDESGRGFTFRKNEPLGMTLAVSAEPQSSSSGGQKQFTARDIVNDWEESHLVDIIRGFGEERYAGRIANAIVEARNSGPIETTFDLLGIIERAVPASYRHGRIHPATRTFQAIRIAVNDELGALQEGLRKGFDRLSLKGRIAVISFHSLEDRIVKQFFNALVKEGRAGWGNGISKKIITPSEEEQTHNPRSRSGKLRVIEKR